METMKVRPTSFDHTLGADGKTGLDGNKFPTLRPHDANCFEPQVLLGLRPDTIAQRYCRLQMDGAAGCTELTQAEFGLMGQFIWLGQEVSLAAHRTIVGPSPLSNRSSRDECRGPKQGG